MISSKHSRPVIIEGPDGSGKSTLIRNAFPDAKHMGGPPKTADELVARLNLVEPGNVYDRWTATSEQVYGMALRHSLLVPPSILDEAILRVKPIIIYCRAPDEIMDDNLRGQEERPHKSWQHISTIIEKRERIRELYDELMQRLPSLGCDVFHYDYTIHGAKQ